MEILRNPKYTGYQVYNRRAARSRSGKVNDLIEPFPVRVRLGGSVVLVVEQDQCGGGDRADAPGAEADLP
jgi:uncharacterized protein YaaQ